MAKKGSIAAEPRPQPPAERAASPAPPSSALVRTRLTLPGLAIALLAPRIARAEIGFGLEGRLPDVLVRRLLDERLARPFARGDFEGGLDAFIRSIGQAQGVTRRCASSGSSSMSSSSH